MDELKVLHVAGDILHLQWFLCCWWAHVKFFDHAVNLLTVCYIWSSIYTPV